MLFRLALSQMLFGAVFQFSNLFLNTYFFRVYHDTKQVAQYNFWMFLFWGIFFFVGFRLCEKNTRIGMFISGFAALLGMTLLLMGNSNVLWLGLFLGMSGGLFWPSYLSIYRSLGKLSEGAGTFAKASVLASTISIFIPILFGHLVEGKGYLVGFIVLMVLSLALCVMSLFMPSFQTERILLTKESFRYPGFMAANMMSGVYFSFIGIASGLLVFMTGQGEAGIGTFATFYGVLTLAVNVLMAYFLPKKYSSWAMLTAAVCYIVCCSLFFTGFDSRIIVFNFLVAAAGPLFNNAHIGLQFLFINRQFPNGEEGLLMRELYLTVGRLAFFGYMAFFGIDLKSVWFYVLLTTASVFPLAIFLIVGRWEEEHLAVKMMRFFRKSSEKPAVSS